MRRLIVGAAIAIAALTLTGCYIGRAEFRGEDMRMYPFFGTSAAPMEAAK